MQGCGSKRGSGGNISLNLTSVKFSVTIIAPVTRTEWPHTPGRDHSSKRQTAPVSPVASTHRLTSSGHSQVLGSAHYWSLVTVSASSYRHHLPATGISESTSLIGSILWAKPLISTTCFEGICNFVLLPPSKLKV